MDSAAFALHYRVQPADPRTHCFAVAIRIPRPPPGPLTLTLPAWIPGSYLIRDFARNLLAIAASDADGRPIPLDKRDKQTWIGATPAAGPVVIRYRVYAGELSVRAAHLDATHGYCNGPALLLRVVGLDNQPCRIELAPPDGEPFRTWRLATSLAPLDVGPSGFGTYQAVDYADLIDHPVEMGQFDELTFAVRGIPHRLILNGRHHADLARLTADLTRLCARQAALFGELPIERYLFLVTAVGEGYGGLEHRDSSSLLCTRDDLPHPGDPPSPQSTEGYRRVLGLCSHEYFHLWLVKRIRPQALIDGGLDREVHTRALWAFEGITSYYDDLLLLRAGCIDPPAYLGLLAGTITRVLRAPGRRIQTLAESSFDAWTKFYQPDENAPNAIVSYYAKGALVALALDLTLRRDTGGACSLDHLLRALWARHGRTGVGVPERGIEALAGALSGLDLTGFFARMLDGTADPDLPELLATLGIGMRLRAARGPEDWGGWVERFEPAPADARPRPDLALRLRAGAGEAAVAHVLTGGAGEAAGIAPGDVIVAVDGLRATAANLERLVARAAGVGTGIALHLFRRDELLTLTVHPRPAPAETCELCLLDAADLPESVQRARADWLAGLGAADPDAP